ncbi:hypothetical protein TSAR_006751 [Trichomalopsis sarcophagae]|uniref:Uncharacterized protein n=1 Tax=Trichomalopsis sarcophagae TaxID=543379 RepID=A0A232EUE2_9HYME|nr:hypothetical protein TSAR_006751 [Trichomalopsis sarcophagae]
MSADKIKKWLTKHDSYTFHKAIRFYPSSNPKPPSRSLKHLKIFSIAVYENHIRYRQIAENDVLMILVDVYNKTPRSTVKMEPASVTIYNAHKAQKIGLLGHLHCNIMNQDRFLINGDDVRLMRFKDAFCFMNASSTEYSVHIFEATLLVRRVKVSPTVLIAHAKTLSSATAKYPITRVEVKTFTMHRGTIGDSSKNVILGQVPKRVILGFVDYKAFNGDKTKKNPSNFLNFSINFLSLYVDGTQIPSITITIRIEVRFDKPLTKTRNCILYLEFNSVLEIDAARQVVLDFNSLALLYTHLYT